MSRAMMARASAIDLSAVRCLVRLSETRCAPFRSPTRHARQERKVTDDLFDVAERFDEFAKRRAELKGLFRPGLFLIN
jgi:hypothetical protein